MKSVMIKIILLSLTGSFSVAAQNQYKEFKVMTWAELQVFQLDSLYATETLALVEDCPKSLKQLQENFTKYITKDAIILGYKYIWSQFYNKQYDWCLVKHDKQDTLTHKSPNPESYEVLSTLQAQILLSAIERLGFEQKGYDIDILSKKQSKTVKFNWKVAIENYKKYGGKMAVYQYIRNNNPALTDETFEKAKHQYNNPNSGPYDFNTSEVFMIQFFERVYSAAQKQELIDIKNNRNYTKSHLKLLNKQWLLVSYQLKGLSKTKVLNQSNFYLKLDKDSYDLRGSIDCNNYSGKYTLNKNKLTIKQGATTLIGCLHPQKELQGTDKKNAKELWGDFEREKPYQAQSKAIGKLLRDIYRYKISRGKLTLLTKEGSRLFYEKIN